jgi:hypothetical protein
MAALRQVCWPMTGIFQAASELLKSICNAPAEGDWCRSSAGDGAFGKPIAFGGQCALEKAVSHFVCTANSSSVCHADWKYCAIC